MGEGASPEGAKNTLKNPKSLGFFQRYKRMKARVVLLCLCGVEGLLGPTKFDARRRCSVQLKVCSRETSGTYGDLGRKRRWDPVETARRRERCGGPRPCSIERERERARAK